MTTAREYLVAAGLAKPGRGKFSKAGHEALEKALSDGVKFSDYPKEGKPVKSVTKAEKPTAAPKPAPSAGVADVLFEDEFRYPEKEYRAVSYNDGKKVVHSMREVCNNCRVSLVMCSCGDPSIYGDKSVKIERLK